MKSSPALHSPRFGRHLAVRLIAPLGLAALLTGLAGCGQTGALYMPKIPGKPVATAQPGADHSAAAPAAPATVPLSTPMSLDPAMSTLPTPPAPAAE